MNKIFGWDIDNLQEGSDYIDLCKIALVDDNVFNNFKSNPHYTPVLEHVDENLGRMYYENICRDNKYIFDNYIEKFCENDRIGNPRKSSYGGVNISPTTIRYIKNTIDIASLCGDSEIKKIVEVGGGYGGLCKTLSVVCDFDEYILVDLPEVSQLQRKYIDNFPEIKDKVKCVSCLDYGTIHDVDLFISNYALSELTVDAQMNYYDNIVTNSKTLYITYNNIKNNNYNIFMGRLKEDKFIVGDNKFVDCFYRSVGHNNIIIGAVKEIGD